MALTTFADGRLLGERRGTTPQVLALHGWGRDRRDFDAALEGLDSIAVDLPGFGTSPPPEEPWGSADYAAAILPVLEAADLPAVIVGHSFGGRVAVQLALLAPESVRALVLSGVPLLRSGARRRPALRYRALRALRRHGIVDEARMERARSRYGSADYRAASGVMREVLVRVVNETYEAELPRLSCPVELVWGEHDTAAPLAVARRAAEYITDVRISVCEGGDHFACLRDPGMLRAAIARHCR